MSSFIGYNITGVRAVLIECTCVRAVLIECTGVRAVLIECTCMSSFIGYNITGVRVRYSVFTSAIASHVRFESDLLSPLTDQGKLTASRVARCTLK